jgi:hypothetical protein
VGLDMFRGVGLSFETGMKARQIVIEFDFGAGNQPDIHRVRNFNDSLYYMARQHDSMVFSLDQIDKTNGQRVTVKSARRLRRVSAKIEKFIEDHGFVGIARLSVVNSPTDA